MGGSGFRGFVNHVRWYAAIAGGNFANGRYCGARTLNTNANPWDANGNVTVRGVCDLFMDILRTVGLARRPTILDGSARPTLSAKAAKY